MATTRKKVLSSISLVLVCCLLTVSAPSRLSFAMQGAGPDHRNTLRSPDLADGSASLFTLESRSGSSPINGFFYDLSLFEPIPPVFYHESSQFFIEFKDRCTHRAERATAPVRAPPLPPDCHF